MSRYLSIAAAIGLVVSSAGITADHARADTFLQLNWEKLVPPALPMKNFLEGLPPEQQLALELIDYWRSFPTGKLDSELELQRDAAKQGADEERKKFAEQGIDIDSLYGDYIKWLTEIERRGKLTEKAYNNKHVSIAGYLLPLDFNPQGSREFLLVPYVGACIHVPPPPPNQVVYVRTAKPHQISDLFEGVMVSGEMKVEPVSKDLTFIDGASEVEASYTLERVSIEPYQYEEEPGQ